jgi:HSP20 family protein
MNYSNSLFPHILGSGVSCSPRKKSINGDWFESVLSSFFDSNLGGGLLLAPSAKTTEGKEFAFSPRVEAQDTEKTLEITAELPGVSKDDIKLSVKNDLLTLSGEKKQKFEKADYSEVHTGSFSRSFRLDPKHYNLEEVNVSRDSTGVLHISIPKRIEAKSEERLLNIADIQ